MTKVYLFYLCSLRGDCRDAALDPLYWISYKSGRYCHQNISVLEKKKKILMHV